MSEKAQLEKTENGTMPKSEGWYVMHASEARWFGSDRFGQVCLFEGEPKFPEIGVNIHVVQPGQAACLYHRENAQENFLVLSGECLLLIEGEEVPLRAGHFVHCPPWATHVFLGAGEEPCAILMIGYRPPERDLLYPVDDLAAKHGASVEQETSDPSVAYASSPPYKSAGPGMALRLFGGADPEQSTSKPRR